MGLRFANVKLLQLSGQRLHNTARTSSPRLSVLRVRHRDVTQRTGEAIAAYINSGLIAVITTGEAGVVEDVELGCRLRNWSHCKLENTLFLSRRDTLDRDPVRGGNYLATDKNGLEPRKHRDRRDIAISGSSTGTELVNV